MSRKRQRKPGYWERLTKRRQYNPVHPHCGPFNSVDSQKPGNDSDSACWKHDKEYGELMKEHGLSVYTHFNSADQELLDNESVATVYRQAFRAKKLVAPKLVEDKGYTISNQQGVAAEWFSPKDYMEEKELSFHVDSHLTKYTESVQDVPVYNKDSSKDPENSMPRNNKRKRGKRVLRSSRALSKKINRHIKLHKDESALQRSHFSEGFHLQNTVFNEANTSVYTINPMSQVKGYSIPSTGPFMHRSQLTAGAYTAGGIIDYARVDLSFPNVQIEGGATTTSDVKVKYEGGLVKFTLRNNDLVDCYIEIMQARCMCSTSSSFEYHIDSNFDQLRHATSGDMDQYPNVPLTKVPINNDNWKKMGKVVKIHLNPASQAIFKVKVPKLQYPGRDVFLDTAETYFRKMTIQVLFRIHGGIAHDTVDRTLVGLGKSSCDIMAEEWHSYRHVFPPILRNLQVSNNLDAIAAMEQAQLDRELNANDP